MSEHLLTIREGAVLRLRFNRPEKKNAITSKMYTAVADGLDQADADKGVRAILFEGCGDIFTSGNDIADFLAGVSLGNTTGEKPGVLRFIEGLTLCQTPMVAAVQGPAVGIGVTMLLHCDLVYAAPSATFVTPFVDLGLVPEAASSLILPRMAGYQRAAELLIAGKKISAERACEFGFVNEVVAAGELEATAFGAACALAEKAPNALRLTRELMKGDRETILARMALENANFTERLASDEFREAGMAFMQKRKPDFSKLG